MVTKTDDATTVRALLDAQKLTVSDEEFQKFVQAYGRLREAADSLYIPEARYEEPAPQFTATWAG